jgi:hypothetical protein
MSLILMSHWLACVNWAVAENYDYPEDSWMRTSGFVAQNAVSGEMEPENDFLTLYSWALYKVCMGGLSLGVVRSFSQGRCFYPH